MFLRTCYQKLKVSGVGCQVAAQPLAKKSGECNQKRNLWEEVSYEEKEVLYTETCKISFVVS